MQLFQLKRRILLRKDHDCNQHIHFVGIGGSGMCGIASILIQKGYYVTGSDIKKNSDTIRYLLKLGVKIFFNHCDNNINQADIVVISSAIQLDNPEIQAAKILKIPIMKRAEVLSELMYNKYGIAVSGTHGKTTVTSMLTNIYIEAGLDPTFINGGVIQSEKVQARLGHSHYLIVEADESDKSLLWLHPKVEIITNIDTDHMDNYQKNFNFLKDTFIKFLYNLPIDGYAVVCMDDPAIQDIIPRIKRKIITYGFNKHANLCISNYYQYMGISKFTIFIQKGEKLKVILNSAPGRHNILNATAAIAVSIEEGIQKENFLKAMRNFQGTKRRFENLGNYKLNNINGQSGQVMLIDDYGHHPMELYSTIITIRDGWPDKRLIMIFQPHRFTRTYELFNDFVKILSYVDVLLILDIYSAGEKPINGVNSKILCCSIEKWGKIKPIFISNNYILLKKLCNLIRDNDLVLIQGAGTISHIVRSLFFHDRILNF